MPVVCPRCHAPLAKETAGGLCPACLLAQALSLPPGDDAVSVFEENAETADNFGRYELLEELGRGGMGVVYRARERASGRIVALKMILPVHLRSADVMRRFETEIRAAARLDHPHILPVYEIGERDGLLFFSMKLAERGSLANTLAEGTRDTHAAAELIRKLAHAMHHAHQRGVVHRDLKPGNILIDATGEPLVGDFGIAKVLSAELGAVQATVLVGTPSYIAPELLIEGGAVTTAVDIYGLGAIFYELLAGAPPHAGETAGVVLKKIGQSPIDSLQARGRAIDRDLETVVMKCLESRPADRYESALALAQDIERWQKGFPVVARPVGVGGQLVRWSRRKPAVALLSGAVAALACAALVGGFFAVVRIAKERDRAVQAEAQGQQELFRALLAQANAARHTGLAGQRFDGLAAITKAAAIQATPEARDEAAALMALADFRLEREQLIANLAGKQMLVYDRTLSRHAVVQPNGDVIVRRDDNDARAVRLKNPGAANLFFLSAFSDDGNFIAAYYGDALRVWDIAAQKIIVEKSRPLLKAAAGAFWSGWGFSADSKRLALALPDGGYGIYALPAGTELARIKEVPGAQSLRFDSMGTLLAYTRFEKMVMIRDPLTQGNVSTFENPASVSVLAWSPDGRILAVGCDDDTIRCWDVKEGRIVRTLTGHRGSPTQIIFSRDGSVLASNAIDGTVRLWHAESGELLVTVPRHGTEPTMQFSEDGRRFLVTEAGRALWFELATGLDECALMLPPVGRDYVSSGVANSDFSADGRWLAAATKTNVHVWNVENGNLTAQLSIDPKQPDGKSLAFTKDGSGLLVSSRESGLMRYAFDAVQGMLRFERTLWTEPEFNLNDVSADGRIAALSSRQKEEIVFLRTDGSGAPVRVPAQPGIWNVGMSADGRWAVSNSSGAEGVASSDARVWDTTTGRVVHTFGRGKRGEVEFTRDGRFVVVAGSDACAVWHTGTWQPGPALPEGLREAAMFSPSEDGKFLGVLLDDRLWILEGEKFQPLVVLEAPHEVPHDARVRFSPNSHYVALHYSDGTVLQWDLRRMQQQLSALRLGWTK